MKHSREGWSLSVTRRMALLGAGAVGASACSAWPDIRPFPETAEFDVVDAHTHLFSATDLPVKNFVRYVVGPEFKFSPLASRAVGQLLGAVRDASFMTAQWELQQETSLAFSTIDYSREKFISESAKASLALQEDPQGPGVVESDPEQAEAPPIDQGWLLVMAATAVSSTKGTAQDRVDGLDVTRGIPGLAPSSEKAPLSRAQVKENREKVFNQLLKQADEAIANHDKPALVEATPQPGAAIELLRKTGLMALLSQEAGAVEPYTEEQAKFDLTELPFLLRWLGEMLRPRTQHLETYLKTYSYDRSAKPPRVLMHFLVDYDKWLGESPKKGSDMETQVELWSRATAHYRDRVTLKTFAGACPLKHAIEMRRDSKRALETTSFGRLLAMAPTKVAGFKLYPPMGFQPTGNAALPDEAFRGEKGIGGTALRAWQAVETRKDKLGEALDTALNTIYDACIEHDIGVVAHAGPGNQAGKCFGERTSTAFWHEVARQRPTLRMSLGHLVHDANWFIKWREGTSWEPGQDDCKLEADKGWVASSTTAFLREAAAKKWPVYFDLGFTGELIRPDVDDAKGILFFQLLRAWFEKMDPDCEHLVYGTDWIMLGQLRHHADYLKKFQYWAKEACWTLDQRQNFFRRNALRFLNLYSTT